MTKSCGVRETRKKERSVKKSKWTFVSRQYREREMELSLNGRVCEDLNVEVSQREMIVYLLLMRVCNCVHAHCWGLLIAAIYIYILKKIMFLLQTVACFMWILMWLRCLPQLVVIISVKYIFLFCAEIILRQSSQIWQIFKENSKTPLTLEKLYSGSIHPKKVT